MNISIMLNDNVYGTGSIFFGQMFEANVQTFFHLWLTEVLDNPKHRLTISKVAKPWPSYREKKGLVRAASSAKLGKIYMYL